MSVSKPPPVASGRAVCLPGTVRRQGTRLLNQQFWLWGQDIRRDQNVLLRYGFTRARPPGDVQGGRCYTLRIDARRAVVLWGFGIFCGDQDQGGLYLSRFRLDPLLGRAASPRSTSGRRWTCRSLPVPVMIVTGPAPGPCWTRHCAGSALTRNGCWPRWGLSTGGCVSPRGHEWSVPRPKARRAG